MSLQSILAIAETVSIQDHKFAGQMLSRNMRISTSEILTVQPFQFTIKPMNYLQYSTNRSVLSALRTADRITEQYINFGTTGWLNYIAYQGDMSGVQAAACQIDTTANGTSGKNIVLISLPSITSTLNIVKVGDFIQIDRYSYIATANVQRGSGTSVTVPVHRTVMTTVSSATGAVIGQYGTTTSLGGSTYTGVTFPVVLRDYPTYTLVPMTNDSWVQWDGSFNAYEVVL
jgi:hypothetical protein